MPAVQTNTPEAAAIIKEVLQILHRLYRLIMPLCVSRFEWDMLEFNGIDNNVVVCGGLEPGPTSCQLNASTAANVVDIPELAIPRSIPDISVAAAKSSIYQTRHRDTACQTKSDTSGRASQQTRHNFRKSDTHNQLVSLAYARINGMAQCQIFTSLSLPHHHYPAIAPASPRSNMLARRSPDGRKPAGKRPYGVVATPVCSAFHAAGENWSTRARVPEVHSTAPHPMNSLTLAQRRRLSRAQERGETYPWNWFIFAPALLPDPPSKTLPKMLSEDARMTGSGSDRSFKGSEVEERVVFVFSNVLQCAVPVSRTYGKAGNGDCAHSDRAQVENNILSIYFVQLFLRLPPRENRGCAKAACGFFARKVWGAMITISGDVRKQKSAPPQAALRNLSNNLAILAIKWTKWPKLVTFSAALRAQITPMQMTRMYEELTIIRPRRRHPTAGMFPLLRQHLTTAQPRVGAHEAARAPLSLEKHEMPRTEKSLPVRRLEPVTLIRVAPARKPARTTPARTTAPVPTSNNDRRRGVAVASGAHSVRRKLTLQHHMRRPWFCWAGCTVNEKGGAPRRMAVYIKPEVNYDHPSLFKVILLHILAK
ncbi:hypothetical protein B0H10DRAFT_1960641 [Mycena sp. CBHHK59/15]|nr:hypothetical protein B0H10DRAFT_1960641 [Mycena sp. CBHHK59/15]